MTGPMKPIRILVDTCADHHFTNAQMTNAREIIARLDPSRFAVSAFYYANPDPRLLQRPATRLIRLPRRLATGRILFEFLWGRHEILFYVKAAPASRWYFRLRPRWGDRRVTIGTIESQADLRQEPTVAPAFISLWEQTVLRCDYLFSNCASAARSLRAEYGLESRIVPTGVDTAFFTPPSEPRGNGRPRVLFVGSLRPFKRPDLVLDAAARHPEADFVLLGDGAMTELLKARRERERLVNVRLAGALDIEAVREEYRKADLFLFPSRWEGSPKVILEAAASGLPAIAFRDYEPETIVDGETGYVVGSTEELFARVGELVRSPNLRATLGRAARKHAESYDWDVITRRWEAIFTELRDRCPRE